MSNFKADIYIYVQTQEMKMTSIGSKKKIKNGLRGLVAADRKGGNGEADEFEKQEEFRNI